MPTPRQLTEQLARAYALTEILPLRHSNVQEVLDDVASALSEEQLDLELRDQAFWHGDERIDEGAEVTDFYRGMVRCGIESLRLGPGLEKRALGALLDTVRIASISGHLTNLKELVAYHGGALQVKFGAPAEAPSALGRSAGAIFAGALSSTEAGAVVEDGPVESPPPAVGEEEGGPVEEEAGPHAGAPWDPPGSGGDVEAPEQERAPEAEADRPFDEDAGEVLEASEEGGDGAGAEGPPEGITTADMPDWGETPEPAHVEEEGATPAGPIGRGRVPRGSPTHPGGHRSVVFPSSRPGVDDAGRVPEGRGAVHGG